MERRVIPIGQLVENEGQIEGLPRNPRQWTQTDIDRMAKSLAETPELFEARPCIVYPQGDKYIVICGNLRLTGSRKIGLKKIDCAVLPEGMPVSKLKEILIKDNAHFGDWDYDSLANEWDDLPLEEWGVDVWSVDAEVDEKKKEAQEDDFDEEMDAIEVICKRGDIWQLGEHRLMCGDSVSLEDVKKLMEGG